MVRCYDSFLLDALPPVQLEVRTQPSLDVLLTSLAVREEWVIS